MKDMMSFLKDLTQLERKQYHPLVHEIHRQHNISKKTLFYIREYGPHSHVFRTIFKESIRILLFASVLSSIGGLAFENIKLIFTSIIPLIVLFPALNDMIGDYGGIISSKFSSMLHEGKIEGEKWWKNKDIKILFAQVLVISLITAVLSSVISLVISSFSSYSVNTGIALKIFLISIIDVTLLVTSLFFIAVYAGMYFFKEHEDPNNFLIPITTSLADFGNMMLLSILITLFF